MNDTKNLSPLELHGAVAALHALERMRGATLALGQSTEKLDQQITVARSALDTFKAASPDNARRLAETVATAQRHHHGQTACEFALGRLVYSV